MGNEGDMGKDVGTVNEGGMDLESSRSALEIYIEEVSLLDRLSPGEREAAFLNSMAGDSEAQKMLATDFLPDVLDIAKLYLNQGVSVDELVSQGNEALAEGVRLLGAYSDHSEAEGALVRMIMDAMEDLVAEEGEFRENEGRIADRVNNVADTAESIFRETGRDATIPEVMERAGVDREYVTEAVRISGNRIAHLDRNT